MKSLNQNLFFCLVDILKAAVLKDFGLELCYGLKNCLILPKSFVYMGVQFSSVQSLSCVRLFVTPWTTARQASLSITNSQRPPKPMSIKSVMPFKHFILCHPLLLLPSIFPSIRVFSNESALRMRWPKYGVSVSTSVPPMNTQDWSLGLTGWISLQSKGLTRVFSNTTVEKHQFFSAQLLYSPTLTSIHDHWKNHSLD